MPAKVTPLTDAKIRAAKPRQDGKPLKLADGNGLSLWVLEAGRYWRLKFRVSAIVNDKPKLIEKSLSLGPYPKVKAAEARQRAEAARRLLRDGKDPSAERRAERVARRAETGNTFGAIATEWLAKQRDKAATTRAKARRYFDKHAAELRHRPIGEITAPEILAVLRKIEARGKIETAHRVKWRIGQVFRYAIATGRAERDPSADLKGALEAVKTTGRAAVTEPAKIGELLRAIDGYSGQPATAAALKLAPLLFVRPGELRAAEWSEFDLEAAEWRIPASKMKMGEAHIVPLSQQAVAILRELHPVTGHGRYLFPSLRSAYRCMSENTITAALRRLGYSGSEMTGHGFRAMASTCLNEMGWSPDVIERQLAHAPRNKIRAAYNRAQHLTERRRMMAAWADYLDTLRAGSANVVRIGAGAA